MNRETYHYEFGPDPDMDHVEEVLVLATMAVEGLHGRSTSSSRRGLHVRPRGGDSRR